MTKILYVEDDSSSQRLVQRLLTSEGFDVLLADNGIQAIEIASRERPELILMDINIGGLDGYEVTTRLRGLDSLGTVPIVAVTAATLKGDRERAIVAGCTGYIPKPIDIDRFPDQVRAYLVGMTDDAGSAADRAEYLTEYNQRLVQRLEAQVHELERANTELQKLEKLKADFLLLTGHELRTPLTVVYGYLQILKSTPEISASPATEGSPQYLLARASEAVARLSEVVQDILNVSLINANRLELAREPVFLHSTIQSILHNLRSFGPQRQLSFELGSGLSQIPVLEGDPQRLHQAIGNLVSNAVKYTPDGGTISIDAETHADVVHLWVQDGGVGIAEDELPHVFERFYVLEDTSRHRSSKTAFKGGGLGLGLAVAKGIIEAHSGKLWAESAGHDEEKLPGSTFHVLLPIGDPLARMKMP